jgi:hypothetical protein
MGAAGERAGVDGFSGWVEVFWFGECVSQQALAGVLTPMELSIAFYSYGVLQVWMDFVWMGLQ